MALLRASPSNRLTALGTAFLNDCTTADQPFILVLDDYHVISQPAVHQAVGFLLDNLPPQIHLAITSRIEPLLPLPRLRAAGHMTEIRAADLRFDQAETAEFLKRMVGLELSDEQVSALDRRVEGWPAGLQMVAISILGRRQTSKVSELVEDFAGSRRYIFDYLVDEVLNQLEPDVQSFLLQTSLLDQLHPSLCDAVTGTTDSIQILHDLEQRNLFIFPLADDRSWFRYHQLFAELLKQRLNRSRPDLIDELHLRASRWYENNDYPDDAVRHAIEGHCDHRAAGLVERYCTAWLGHSNLHMTKRSLEMLSNGQIRRRPQLGILSAWSLALTNQLDQAESRLNDAEQRLAHARVDPEVVNQWDLSEPTEDLARMEGEIETCRAVLARADGDVERMVQHLDRALSLLPDNAVAQRGTALLYQGFADWMADNGEKALANFAAAIEAGETARRPYTVLSATSAAGRLLLERGSLAEAEAYFQTAFRLGWQRGEETGVVPPVVAEAHTGLGKLALEHNDLSSARHHLEQALRRLEPLGVTEDMVDASLAMARLLRAEGSPDAAADLLAKLGSALNSAEAAPLLVNRVGTFALEVQARDRLTDAGRVDHRLIGRHLAPDADGSEPILYLQEEELVGVARLKIADGDYDGALGLLERLDDATRRAGRLDRLIRVLLLKALAWNAQRQPARALSAVDEALALGEPSGYVGVFLIESDWLGELLTRLPRTSYRDDLLAEMDSSPTTNVQDERIVAPLPPKVVDQLSARELDVLRLLATHLSGPEIAGELYVSANTLKSHTRSIYRKLGVNKRRDAVTEARRIGLL